MTQRYRNALKAFQLADDVWSAALQQHYGAKAGDARYNNKLNGATHQLAYLKIERMAAFKEYESAKAESNEVKR